jgi:hypothetical protein
LLTVAILGCASTATTLRPEQMYVENQGRVPITAVYRKSCGAPSESYQALPRSEIGVGDQLTLPAFKACVDLEVRDASGRVVGRQEHLEPMPETIWAIK